MCVLCVFCAVQTLPLKDGTISKGPLLLLLFLFLLFLFLLSLLLSSLSLLLLLLLIFWGGGEAVVFKSDY